MYNKLNKMYYAPKPLNLEQIGDNNWKKIFVTYGWSQGCPGFSRSRLFVMTVDWIGFLTGIAMNESKRKLSLLFAKITL